VFEHEVAGQGCSSVAVHVPVMPGPRFDPQYFKKQTKKQQIIKWGLKQGRTPLGCF
jgi:hypothetical protein